MDFCQQVMACMHSRGHIFEVVIMNIVKMFVLMIWNWVTYDVHFTGPVTFLCLSI